MQKRCLLLLLLLLFLFFYHAMKAAHRYNEQKEKPKFKTWIRT